MLDGDDDLMLTRLLLVLTCIRAELRARSRKAIAILITHM